MAILFIPLQTATVGYSKPLYDTVPTLNAGQMWTFICYTPVLARRRFPLWELNPSSLHKIPNLLVGECSNHWTTIDSSSSYNGPIKRFHDPQMGLTQCLGSIQFIWVDMISQFKTLVLLRDKYCTFTPLQLFENFSY